VKKWFGRKSENIEQKVSGSRGVLVC